MQATPPIVVVLAGPNGAGKSTSAAHFLRGALAVEEFVNADTIATGLSAYRAQDVAVAAGRILLRRLDYLATKRSDFAFETTLAGRGHLRRLRSLARSGYRTHLVFLALPSADLAVARVADRVEGGGHDVPEEVIRRRFRAGVRNLFEHYVDQVDGWQVYDNAGAEGPHLIASQSPGSVMSVPDQAAWDRLKEIA